MLFKSKAVELGSKHKYNFQQMITLPKLIYYIIICHFISFFTKKLLIKNFLFNKRQSLNIFIIHAEYHRVSQKRTPYSELDSICGTEKFQ